jgi:hypothetical protein
MLNKYFAENELPLMLSVTDVAGILGVSRAFAYSLFHAHDFPVIVIGKRRIVKKDSFLNWLRKKEKTESEEWLR